VNVKLPLAPVYVGRGGVLTGTARSSEEASARAEASRRAAARARLGRKLEHKRRTLEAEMAALQLAFDAETEELASELAEEDRRERTLAADAKARAHLRGGAAPAIPVHSNQQPKGRRS
jgi:circadian clock protein KaiC